MIRTRIEKVRNGSVVAVDVYDEKGRQLLKRGAVIGMPSLKKLKENGIGYVYLENQDVMFSRVFDGGLIAELLKVLWYFTVSRGENNEIIKKYNIEEIKKLTEYNNKTGSKIAYGHVFRYLAGKLAGCIKNNSYYDFFEYRSEANYLPFHAVGRACVSLMLGYQLGLSGKEIEILGVGALLCDIKMNLYKFADRPSGISEAEKKEIMEHTYLSFDAIRKIYGISSGSAAAVLQHHERFDGSGYPKKLKGDRISLQARIISVADVYDALLSDRPFRKEYKPEEAWEYISGNAGLLFDPDVAEAFSKRIAKYRPGTGVVLSDGRDGIVSRNEYGAMENPRIKIIEKKGKNAIITREELRINKKDGLNIIRTQGRGELWDES